MKGSVMKHFFILALILAVAFGTSSASADTSYTFGQWAQDTGLNMPWAFPDGITSLAGLSTYTDLETLDVDGDRNNISDIVPGDFADMVNVRDIELSRNQISSVDSGDFDGLTVLEDLHLIDNQIRSIELGGFSGLTNLEYLHLDNNQLTSIQGSYFDGLSNLKYLGLNGNNISLASSDFTGIGDLEMLGLSHNQIGAIETGDFEGLDQVHILNLEHNQISSIEAGDFDGLDNLYHLNLRGNNITSIEQGDFAGMDNLGDVWFTDNQIGQIQSGAFAGLPLQSLRLSNNPITELNLSNAQLGNFGALNIGDTNITRVNASGATLSQSGLTALMSGRDASFHETWESTAFSFYIGVAELDGIIECDFSGADFSDVTDLSEMYAMADLLSLDISFVQFGASIIDGGYAAVTDLIDALEGQSLAELTIDAALYGAQGSYFDDWAALDGNTLNVVPEPAALGMLAIGALAMVNRKRRL